MSGNAKIVYMNKKHEHKIIQSWNDNASLWTNAVRTQALESRRLVTNEAILNSIATCQGTRILDVGCGEGWLSRGLIKKEKRCNRIRRQSKLNRASPKRKYWKILRTQL